MTRSTLRTMLLVAALIAAAVAFRWAGSDWIMDSLASLHGPRGR